MSDKKSQTGKVKEKGGMTKNGIPSRKSILDSCFIQYLQRNFYFIFIKINMLK